GALQPEDIPGRMKMTEIMFSLFGREFDNIREDLSHALGRISLTSDMWSRGILQGYMAITAHYIIEDE
ncbi:hypothetical protein CYLTODRAFT_326011, partial [Cylindrobasidium torrendii FP15055 ss-10]